jgi:hypothetical protein
MRHLFRTRAGHYPLGLVVVAGLAIAVIFALAWL